MVKLKSGLVVISTLELILILVNYCSDNSIAFPLLFFFLTPSSEYNYDWGNRHKRK